jgi:hypothetical protein
MTDHTSNQNRENIMKKFVARAFAVTALATAAVLAALPAQATPNTWKMSGVTFDDGTKATGSFTIDWASKTWTSFDVATQDGKLPALEYTPSNSSLHFISFGPNSFSINDSAAHRYINFSFDQALSTPGTYAINTSSSWDCNNCGTFRMVTAGSVTSAVVPEPASLALMLPALALIGIARRRKQM